MFSGRIQGSGPRYCPSIEEKLNRFADKNRHQLFIEPEGRSTIEIYLNGFSTSLPYQVQLKALHKIKNDSPCPVSLTIVLGRHAQRLRSTVNAEADNETEIIEWTNNIPELLNKHHLVIGKAGGASVQEALASSCPMIIDSMIPGQEEGNAELVANYGAGLIATNPKSLDITIRNILKENGAKWLSMRKAAKKNGQIKTAHKVAEIATL